MPCQVRMWAPQTPQASLTAMLGLAPVPTTHPLAAEAMAALAPEDRVATTPAEEEGRSVRHCNHQSLSHASQPWKCWA